MPDPTEEPFDINNITLYTLYISGGNNLYIPLIVLYIDSSQQ